MNRFGSNSFENENDQFADNQRFSRQLAENNPRPWNETVNPDRHYMAPFHSHPPYRPDFDYVSRNRQNNYYQQNYNQEPHFYAGAHGDYPANDPGWRHHDDDIWTERNDYKDSDFRYRSGHRNYWHEDYDDQYEAERSPRHRRHPDSFIEHVGEGIREGWNSLFNRHPQNDREEYEMREERRRRHEAERHYPSSGNYPQQRSQQEIRAQERREDEMRRREQERRSHRQSDEWHNSGPDHRDEDFFDPRNFRL